MLFLTPAGDKGWWNQSLQGLASGRGLNRCCHTRRVRHVWCRGLAVANRVGEHVAAHRRVACQRVLPTARGQMPAQHRLGARHRPADLLQLLSASSSPPPPGERTSGSSAISASRHCCKSVICGVKGQSAHRYVPKMRCCALWRPESCHFEGFRLPIRWVSRAVGLWQRANRELERDVAQRQWQGSQGPRGSKVATHCFGDPVGRAMDRFRHGCGERGARGNYCASGGSDGDIQAVLDAGIGRNGAGSTDRQNRRSRRWPT